MVGNKNNNESLQHICTRVTIRKPNRIRKIKHQTPSITRSPRLGLNDSAQRYSCCTLNPASAGWQLRVLKASCGCGLWLAVWHTRVCWLDNQAAGAGMRPPPKLVGHPSARRFTPLRFGMRLRESAQHRQKCKDFVSQSIALKMTIFTPITWSGANLIFWTHFMDQPIYGEITKISLPLGNTILHQLELTKMPSFIGAPILYK